MFENGDFTGGNIFKDRFGYLDVVVLYLHHFSAGDK